MLKSTIITNIQQNYPLQASPKLGFFFPTRLCYLQSASWHVFVVNSLVNVPLDGVRKSLYGEVAH